MHNKNIDARLKLAEQYRAKADEVEAKALRIASFGNGDEYLEASILYFERSFGRSITLPYRYAAIKSGGYWYVTGMQSGYKLTWQELVEQFLIQASEETGEVYYVTKMETIV